MVNYQHHEKHFLEVKNLHVNYRETCILNNLNFKATCNHLIALTGKNGAGKSSLLKAIVGLIPSEGDILWSKKPTKECAYEISYLSQRSDVDWNFPITVKGFIETGRYAHLKKWKNYQEKDVKIVKAAIIKMGLEALEKRQIGSLSGGQQQRVFIARALAQEAYVLLLDEPLNGLDSTGKKDLLEHLRALAHQGHLIIAAIHDYNLIETYFDHTFSLDDKNPQLKTVHAK